MQECIQQFPAKPPQVRHLYEIHISPRALLVNVIVSGEILSGIARLRDFLCVAARQGLKGINPDPALKPSASL